MPCRTPVLQMLQTTSSIVHSRVIDGSTWTASKTDSVAKSTLPTAPTVASDTNALQESKIRA